MSKKESQLGKIYMGGDSHKFNSKLYVPENPLEREFEKAKAEKELEEFNQTLLELEKAKQAELEARLETLELIPMHNKVILLPYPRNPYKKILHNGIIVDYNGEFQNPDSGEPDKLKELVACAQVKEVGPAVDYVKVGDDVFYDTRTCYPIPFFNLGYVSLAEPQILCVMNEKLKERFKME